MLLYPFHVVQTRMIANNERVREIRPSEVFEGILEHEGWRGFYRGLVIATVQTTGTFILLPIVRSMTPKFVGKSKEQINEKKSFREKGTKYLKKKKEKIKNFTLDTKDKVKEKVAQSVNKHEKGHLNSEGFSN